MQRLPRRVGSQRAMELLFTARRLNGPQAAIVTGGASNIGREITLSLSREGVNVILADIDVAQATKVADLASLEGAGRVAAVKCDVTVKEDADCALATTLKTFGAPDVLVNNVGWAEHKLFVDKDWATAEREMAINFWGLATSRRQYFRT